MDDWDYGPLGPISHSDGQDTCCGLLCGRPCPYGLKLPKPSPVEEETP